MEKPDHDDKPVGNELGWERLETTYPYKEPRFKIRRDRVRLPNGHEIDYAYTQTKGALWVVPVTEDNKVILIRQYRYPNDDWLWEVPAGGLFDHEGSLEELAHRELREEIGAVCEELIYIGRYYGAPSASDTVCHVMMALGTRLTQVPELEQTEFIEIHPKSVREVMALVRRGEICDGRSALALFLCEPYLKE
jgi:ADP-ribose pyrophosphatase